jgi:hypothetical protein
MPLPFPSLDSAPPARGQADAFRALVLARSVDEAFKLAPGAPLPRTKAAFEALVREGSPRIEGYLRAVQARLSRAVANPGKDAGKAEPFPPPWEAFLARRATVRDQAAAQGPRWAFEELRVAIFAPEVTTPVSVTVAKLGAALAALR